MRRSLASYRFTSCSNAAASPFLQAWTSARSSYALSAAAHDVELLIALVVPITASRVSVLSHHVRICSQPYVLSGATQDQLKHCRLICAADRVNRPIVICHYLLDPPFGYPGRCWIPPNDL